MDLGQILDVELPLPSGNGSIGQVPVPIPDVSQSANNNVQQDANEARNNVRQLIAQGSQALNELLSIAKDLKTPRAYEVAGNMLKTMAELNHDLMQVHQEEMSLSEPEAPPEQGDIHIGQAVFVGSTSDLGELVKQRRAQRNATKQVTVEAETIPSVQAETSRPEVLPQEPAS